MAKIKTPALTGAALDWAVAKCEGANWEDGLLVWHDEESVKRQCRPNAYSTEWAQGGPIIEREKISVLEAGDFWGARPLQDGVTPTSDTYGPTPLIAARRCYVASKMDDEVDVPEELL